MVAPQRSPYATPAPSPTGLDTGESSSVSYPIRRVAGRQVLMNDGGFGGAGGASGLGGAGGAGGGGGGEDIGVAQEADSPCCCSISVSGYMSCNLAATCPPYTTSTPGACDSPPPPEGCSLAEAPGVPGAAGVMWLVLFATAAAITLRRRFARRLLVPSAQGDEAPEEKSEI
jgi:hypothetical protein